MSFDLTIIAIVFTLIILLVFFSAIVLYLAFRIKETFRKETRRGANIAKTAFLIGILFLAGAVMFFSASTLTNINNQHNQTAPTPTPSNTASPTATASPYTTTSPVQTNKPGQTPSPSTSPSPTPTNTQPSTTPTPTSNLGAVSFTVNFSPSPATTSTTTTMTISIINPTGTTLQNAVIQTTTLFTSDPPYFTTTDSRVNTLAGTINLGNLPTGNPVITIQLQATRAAQVSDTFSLTYQGIQNPITQQVSIRIIGK